MTDTGLRQLSSAIFNNAISEYVKCLKMLKNKRLSPAFKEELEKNVAEGEEFFQSEWADNLAECVGIKFSPEKLIEKLRSEV